MAAALLLSSTWILGAPLNEMLLVAGAAGAFLVYTVDRGFGRRPEDEVNRPLAVADRRWAVASRQGGPGHLAGGERLTARVGFLEILGVSVLFIVFALVLVLALSTPVLVAGGVVGALGLWYALPVRCSLKRMLGRARSPVIAAVWGVGVVLLPALSMLGANPPGESWAPALPWAPGSSSTPSLSWAPVLLLAAYRTLWLLPNVLAAEYVDRAGDIHAGNPGLTATWSRNKLYHVLIGAGGAAAILGGAAAASLATTPTAIALWLALDLAGLGAQILLARPRARLDGRRVFELDLLAMWPVLPAALFLI